MNLDSSTHYSNFSTWGIKGTRTDEMYFVNNKSLKGVYGSNRTQPFAHLPLGHILKEKSLLI